MLHFQRKVTSGRKFGVCSDLLVYLDRQRKNKKGPGVCLRVSGKVMERLRWRAGDYVEADYDPNSKRWIVAISDAKTGNKLSGKGTQNATGLVRFSIEPEMAFQLGLEGDSGYDCRLVDGSTESAVFERV